MHERLTICDHPLITHRLSIMRDKDTPSAEFRRLMREIAMFLTYEATRDFKTKEIEIDTPLEQMKASVLAAPSPVLVSILRAGNGFLDGALEVLPDARVGFLGMYRDEETLTPVDYYSNLPSDLASAPVILLDPMLATGHSALAAIRHLRESGARDLRMITLVAAQESIERLFEIDKHIQIASAALDYRLNESGYILPGLGDAGDRVYNSL